MGYKGTKKDKSYRAPSRKSNRLIVQESQCSGNAEDENDDHSEFSMNTADEEFIENDLISLNDEEASVDFSLQQRSERKRKFIIQSDEGSEISGPVEQIDQEVQPESNELLTTREQRKATSEINKLPGDSCFPLSTWSLTISKNSDDVPNSGLQILKEFLENYCTRGKHRASILQN